MFCLNIHLLNDYPISRGNIHHLFVSHRLHKLNSMTQIHTLIMATSNHALRTFLWPRKARNFFVKGRRRNPHQFVVLWPTGRHMIRLPNSASASSGINSYLRERTTWSRAGGWVNEEMISDLSCALPSLGSRQHLYDFYSYWPLSLSSSWHCHLIVVNYLYIAQVLYIVLIVDSACTNQRPITHGRIDTVFWEAHQHKRPCRTNSRRKIRLQKCRVWRTRAYS